MRYIVLNIVMDKKYYTIGSVEKLCDLLELMSSKSSWDLNELAIKLGAPKTSVHRFLLTLADKGYVIQEKRRGSYSLSYKLFSLGSKVLEKNGLLQIVHPFIERLSYEVNETCNLVVPSGAQMLVADKCVSSHALRQDVILGSTFSILNSASGMVYLAFCEEKEQEFLLNQLSTNASEITLTNLKKYKELEKTIRFQRYAVDKEEVYAGVSCIATPIIGPDNNACGAISLSMPSSRFSEEEKKKIIEPLLQTGLLISRRLGANL